MGDKGDNGITGDNEKEETPADHALMYTPTNHSIPIQHQNMTLPPTQVPETTHADFSSFHKQAMMTPHHVHYQNATSVQTPAPTAQAGHYQGAPFFSRN